METHSNPDRPNSPSSGSRQPVQAMGAPADKGKPDGTNVIRKGDESQGGSYPHPGSGYDAKGRRFIGGQSDNRYYGGGQIAGDGAKQIDAGLDTGRQLDEKGGRRSG